MPSAKPPPPPAPGQPQLRYTTFAPVGFLNAKNVASSFSKSDSQSWFARRSSEQEWDTKREGKRRRLMASEDEITEEAARTGEGEGAERVRVKTLVKAPEGGVREGKQASRTVADGTITPLDPLHRTLIIHPGSRFLRVGLASSLAPVAVPNVIARKLRGGAPNGKGKEREQPASAATAVDGIAAPPVIKPEEIVAQVQKQEAGAAASTSAPPVASLPPLPPAAAAGEDVPMKTSPLSSPRDSASDHEDDDSTSYGGTPRPSASTSGAAGALAGNGAAEPSPLEAKIASLKGDLRARMRAYKLRGQGNGNSQAATYNATVVPEEMGAEFEGDHEWTTGEEEYYVGNKAVRLPDPESSGYTLRYPYDRGGFNTEGYRSAQELLGDVEAILVGALRNELGIEREELKDYSAILLIPDLYDATYVREMSDLLLRTIGFKQLCLMQESLCATFGAGVSSGCVVDIGAKTSTITCVEEGLVLPETRMVLDFGGDDITSFLHVLLMRINFPYKDADLTKWYDWTVIEDLKERLVVLSEGDIGLNLYDFYIRHPGETTKKYTLRIYDDCIMAPYALFAPRVIDFEQKRRVTDGEGDGLWSKEVDENVEIGAGGITNAMRNSTKFLLAPPAAASSSLLPPGAATAGGSSHAGSPAPPSLAGTPVIDDPNSSAFSTLPSIPPAALPTLPPPAPAAAANTPVFGGSLAPPAASGGATPVPSAVPSGPIDVKYESSKLPLDVAVVESILAAGPAEERMKKVAANLLVVGGTGGIHNIGFAVESRVAPALAARVPFLTASQITYVPCPREIEPENLAWKGIASLAKLDAANETWIRREEWDMLGMRAVRERAFYWA
ncbi:hypothetical protein JCM8097_003487 [Rhodosporidiobolus ruineniae]